MQGGGEQSHYELDLARNSWLPVMDVTTLDRSKCLKPAEGRHGGSQGSKALTVSKDPFHSRVIALDEVVAPLLVDMPDAVGMWVIPAINLADDAP